MRRVFCTCWRWVHLCSLMSQVGFIPVVMETQRSCYGIWESSVCNDGWQKPLVPLVDGMYLLKKKRRKNKTLYLVCSFCLDVKCTQVDKYRQLIKTQCTSQLGTCCKCGHASPLTIGGPLLHLTDPLSDVTMGTKANSRTFKLISDSFLTSSAALCMLFKAA